MLNLFSNWNKKHKLIYFYDQLSESYRKYKLLMALFWISCVDILYRVKRTNGIKKKQNKTPFNNLLKLIYKIIDIKLFLSLFMRVGLVALILFFLFICIFWHSTLMKESCFFCCWFERLQIFIVATI